MFAVTLAMYTELAPETIAEMFPTRHRSKGKAIGYGISVTVSGFRPYLAVWSTAYFAMPFAPIYGVTTAAIVGALFLFCLDEAAVGELR
jgi:predicted PurR-regulated permease PerM